MGEIEEILKDLEQEDVDIDELSSKVKRALDLISFCKERIEHTELEIKKVIKDFENKSDKP